ncbi:hypothetical protein D9M71_314940 [compost metagenome]
MSIARLGIVMMSLVTISACASFSEQADPRLVGSWRGERETSSACRYLSWDSQFDADGKFTITFFSDAEHKARIQTEKGTWRTYDGINELKTNGVPTPELYRYTLLDANTVKYVNIVSDPSADCQSDYEFVEKRIK